MPNFKKTYINTHAKKTYINTSQNMHASHDLAALLSRLHRDHDVKPLLDVIAQLGLRMRGEAAECATIEGALQGCLDTTVRALALVPAAAAARAPVSSAAVTSTASAVAVALLEQLSQRCSISPHHASSALLQRALDCCRVPTSHVRCAALTLLARLPHRDATRRGAGVAPDFIARALPVLLRLLSDCAGSVRQAASHVLTAWLEHQWIVLGTGCGGWSV